GGWAAGGKLSVKNLMEMSEIVFRIETGGDLTLLEILRYKRVFARQGLQSARPVPRGHRVALHSFVRLLPLGPFLDQGQQQPLRIDESTRQIEVPLHVGRIDDQLFH